jgi:hypothetical protein
LLTPLENAESVVDALPEVFNVMQHHTRTAAALFIALIAGTGAAGAQTMASPAPMSSATPKPTSMSSPMAKSKKNVARHGPPIEGAGANSGTTSNPQSGTNIPSTSGATH